MAEIKKINGNTLCDETARETAEEAKAAAVQADWNESDPESPAYIQNRIGGYKRSEAERLVEYDETTAEYIDVDATGSGTAMRYRKASDTLVRKEDWVGGKTVIVIDTGSGEQETALNIGTGESNAIEISEKEFAAGKIWLTSTSGFCCGIIAPQETDLSASADGVSVVASQSGIPSGVVPKGVWIMDMPYAMNLMYDGGTTGYHKAVYCGGAMVKIPEEYLDTTTAEEAQATAEEAQATAEEAQATAEEAQATAEEAQATAGEAQAFRRMSEVELTIPGAYGDAKYSDYKSRTFTKAFGFVKPKVNGNITYKLDTVSEKATIVEVTSTENKVHWRDSENCIHIFKSSGRYYSNGDDGFVYNVPEAGVYFSSEPNMTNPIVTDATIPCLGVSGVWIGGKWVTVSEGKLLLDGEPVAPTYTAGDGIAIEDGVITADTASSATEATEFYLKSSTADSAKRFKITVDDTGALTATEVV